MRNGADTITPKQYDISFIGTYYNYRSIIANIRSFNKDLRFIANRFLTELHHNVNLPAEKALEKRVAEQKKVTENAQILMNID